jgi:predicted nucleic-acid-binding Zn-ribbon protein
MEASAMEQNTAPSCPRCNVTLRGLGQLPIRTGGVGAGWHFLFGEWADMGESVRPLDIYRCEKCGRLEFYDHDFSLPQH